MIFSIDFVKTVLNVPKLDRELRELNANYLYLTIKGDALKVFLNGTPTQTEVNALSSLVSNFVEVSVVDTLAEENNLKGNDGITAYKKIIAYIDTASPPIFTSVDGMLVIYDQLIPLRCLLRDGFFVSALRRFVKAFPDNTIFDATTKDLIRVELRACALKYGSSVEELDYIEAAEVV